MVERLRCRAVSQEGDEIFSDMGTEMWGGATAPSPGWLMRAALATCDATLILMRAAELGVELTALEVEVDSISDDRGLLGVDDSVPGGLFRVLTRYRLDSNNADAETRREIVEWCDQRSPVADAIRRAVPSEVETVVV